MKKLFFPLLSLLLLAFSATIVQQKSFAQNQSFRNVQLFITSAGRMVFFNQNNGTIYIYDDDGQKCTFSAQLEELGKPIKPIKSPGAQTEIKVPGQY